MEEKDLAGFTLDDFIVRLTSLMQSGTMQRLVGQMPELKCTKEDAERDTRRLIGMINSMTIAERRDPKLIDRSRRKRIAQGSGTQIQGVSALIKQFERVSPVMKMMAGGIGERMQAIQKLQRQVKRDVDS